MPGALQAGVGLNRTFLEPFRPAEQIHGIVRGNVSTLSSGAGVTASTTTWTTAPLSGSKVVVGIFTGTTDAEVPTSVVDNGSPARTFTQDMAITLGSFKLWVYYADDVRPSGTYSVTVNWNITVATDAEVLGVEVRNAAPGGHIDSASSTSTATTESAGPAGFGTNNYYFAIVSDSGGPGIQVTNAPFNTLAVQPDGGGHEAGVFSDYIGDGAQSCSWTQGSIATGRLIAVFAPLVVRPPVIAPRSRPSPLLARRQRVAFVPPAAGPAAISGPLQTGTLVSATSSPTATLPSGSTAGTLLVAAITSASATSVISMPAGWVQGPSIATGGIGQAHIWYYPGNPGGISSVLVSGTLGITRAQLSEWSSADPAAPLETSGSASQGVASTTLSVSSAGNVGGSGRLAVTCFMPRLAVAATDTFTPDTGWANLGSTSATSTTSHQTSDYDLGPGSGAVATEVETGSSGTWVGVIAVFLPGAAVPLQPLPLSRRPPTPWLRYAQARRQRSSLTSFPPAATAANPDIVGVLSRRARAIPPPRTRARSFLVPVPPQFNPPWRPGPGRRPAQQWTVAWRRAHGGFPPSLDDEAQVSGWQPPWRRAAVRPLTARKPRPGIPVFPAAPNPVLGGQRPRQRGVQPRRSRFVPPPFVAPVVANPDFTAWARRARASWPPRTRVRTAPVPWGQAPLAPNPDFTAWARRSRTFVPPRTRARTTPVPWGQALAVTPPPWVPVARRPLVARTFPRRHPGTWQPVADAGTPQVARRRILQLVPRRRSSSATAPPAGQLVPTTRRARGAMLAPRRRGLLLPVRPPTPAPPWVVPFYHRTLVWRFQLGRRTGRWRGWTPGQASPLPPPTTLRFYLDDTEPQRSLATSRPSGVLDDTEPQRQLGSSEPQRQLDENEPNQQPGTTVKGQ